MVLKFIARCVAALALLPMTAMAEGIGPFTYESVLYDASRKVDLGGCTDVAVVDIPDIRFALDSAALTPEGEVQMDDLARVMLQRRFLHDRFMLEGHADASGDDGHNLDLSQRRARTVRAAMIRRGVAEARISTRGYGEWRLLYPDRPLHAHNRRVAFVVLDAGAVVSAAAARADDLARGSGRASAQDLSVQLRLQPRGERHAYIADPAVDRAEAGDSAFLCVAASRPGMLEIEARSDDEPRFRSLGKWHVPAEVLVRAPSTGALVIEGAARSETLRLKFVTCGAPGMACGEEVRMAARFESIVQGRARPRPAKAQDPTLRTARCGAPGVICRELTLRRR